MDEDRKRELEQLLARNTAEKDQAKREQDAKLALTEAFRARFKEVAEAVIEPVMREFEQSVRGNGFSAEVQYERRANSYDRVYLHVQPAGRTPERYPESRKMAIFRAEIHAYKVTFFDNSIHQLGGEHGADATIELEELTRAKVEELVYPYVKRVVSGQVRS